MKCTECSKDLIWGGDHTYEDYGLEGNGIVTNCSCPNEDCDVEQVLIYKTINDLATDTSQKNKAVRG